MSQSELFCWNNHFNFQMELSDQRMTQFETVWIEELLHRFEQKQPSILNVKVFWNQFSELLKSDQTEGETAHLLSEVLSDSGFKALIKQFAVDGLTEANAMFAILPKLEAKVRDPVMRILLDEFGCGNPKRVHSAPFADLLHELGLSSSLRDYIDVTNIESFAFVNIYHWLTKRAPSLDYYLGALAYTEAIIPHAFNPYANACKRLGIANSAYFTEHIHIDTFHLGEAKNAIFARSSSKEADFCKMWLGVMLAKFTSEEATKAAVKHARKFQ